MVCALRFYKFLWTRLQCDRHKLLHINSHDTQTKFFHYFSLHLNVDACQWVLSVELSIELRFGLERKQVGDEENKNEWIEYYFSPWGRLRIQFSPRITFDESFLRKTIVNFTVSRCKMCFFLIFMPVWQFSFRAKSAYAHTHTVEHSRAIITRRWQTHK